MSNNVLSIIIIFLLSLLIVTSGVFYITNDYKSTIVSGDSMEPTIQNCDIVFYNENPENIKRGDIIISEVKNDENKRYIKRVYKIINNYNIKNSNYKVKDYKFIKIKENKKYKTNTIQKTSKGINNAIIVSSDNGNKIEPIIVNKTKVKKIKLIFNNYINYKCNN